MNRAITPTWGVHKSPDGWRFLGSRTIPVTVVRMDLCTHDDDGGHLGEVGEAEGRRGVIQ